MVGLFSKTPEDIAFKKNIDQFKKFKKPKHQVNIAMCGKYTELPDAYKSVLEAFIHAGVENDARVNVRINFRDNHEVKRFFQFDEKGYLFSEQPVVTIDQKIVGKPEDETNLCFMLDIMPNVFTMVSNDERQKDIYPDFNTKNIHMKCKYLNF